MNEQKRSCPQCSQVISPEDTIVFGHGLLGHLDCRRPRVLSAEERTLLFLYCPNHKIAECSTCLRQFFLREIASLDRFGVRLHVCPHCHADLTDSIRAHLYGCTMLPALVRHRAQAAREAARNLVRPSHQVSNRADVRMREAEAALHALRASMRQPPRKRSVRGAESSETTLRDVGSRRARRLSNSAASVSRIREVSRHASMRQRRITSASATISCERW